MSNRSALMPIETVAGVRFEWVAFSFLVGVPWLLYAAAGFESAVVGTLGIITGLLYFMMVDLARGGFE